MRLNDFSRDFDKLDNEEIYANIHNTPWYHDAVYELFSEAEFERRRSLMRRAMAERGYDCLIVPGGQSNWSQGAGMTWLSGLIDTRGMAQFVVLAREGEPLLVYGMGGSHAEVVRRTVSVKDVWAASRGRFADRIVEWIQERGLERGRIGILECISGSPPEFPPQAQVGALEAGLPDATIEFAPGLFHELAYLKSDEEIEAIAKAGVLAVLALKALIARAAPGVTEHALAAAATRVILAGGGRPDFIRVGSTSGASPAIVSANPIPSCRKLGTGDLILAEVSAGFMGVTAQVGNPVCVGNVAPALRKFWNEAAQPGFSELESLLKPGVSLESIRRAGSFYRERGCQCAPLLLHGLDIAASSPWVYVERWQSEPYEERLKSGMIVVLKPNAIAPDGGWGMRVSRTYAITEQGHQRLTDYPLELTATSHA